MPMPNGNDSTNNRDGKRWRQQPTETTIRAKWDDDDDDDKDQDNVQSKM
jgi:hypothetical protein